MIGIEGQWIFDIQINGDTVLSSQKDLIYFRMEERSGNVLPQYKCVFIMPDQKYLKFLNEGNTISFGFGRTKDDVELQEVAITGLAITPTNSVVSVEGVLNSPYYSLETYCKIYEKQSSRSCLEKIATRMKYFTFESNVDESSDKQIWIQPNVTDKVLVDEVWMHAKVPKSFSSVAITYDRHFRYYDIIKKIKQKDPDWIISPNNQDTSKTPDNFIQSAGASYFSNESGQFNNWIGYPRIAKIININDSEVKYIAPEEVNMFAKQQDKNAYIHVRYDEDCETCDNQHKDYYQCYKNQVYNLNKASNFQSSDKTTGQYYAIHALDMVEYKNASATEKSENEFTTGRYIISAVNIIIADNQFEQGWSITRDAPAATEGDF